MNDQEFPPEMDFAMRMVELNIPAHQGKSIFEAMAHGRVLIIDDVKGTIAMVLPDPDGRIKR